MDPAHDNLTRQPAHEADGDNVVEFRDGEALTALVDQPLPTDAEQALPEKLSILVQIRQARFASRASRTGVHGWRDPNRWAVVSVALGGVLIIAAGVIEVLGG